VCSLYFTAALKLPIYGWEIGSSPTKNLPTILPMPLKTHEEERSDSLLVIDFDLGDNLLDKHRLLLHKLQTENVKLNLAPFIQRVILIMSKIRLQDLSLLQNQTDP
jgi:hypothetical protein